MSALVAELRAFAQESKTIFAESHARALALPANTVQVWPGGATFSTITDALNSITNAGPKLQYQVAVGSGIFKETVVMKDYVYITGAGQTNTTITAQAQGQNPAGVVSSAANCGISEVAINAVGGSWGEWPIGIKLIGTGNFHISGVTINSGSSDLVGNNVRGISNNTGSYTGLNIVLGSSILNIQGGENSTSIGVDFIGWAGASPAPIMLVDVSAIVVSSAGQSFGVSTSGGSSVTLDDSKISAGTFSLYNSDQISPIVANQCSIAGPVSAGVTINN